MSTLLPRSTPFAEGIDLRGVAAFLGSIDEIAKDIHSFILVRHGKVVAEAWWEPYERDTPHVLYSLSKSFCSTAVGFAVGEGLISLDDPLIQFFPDDLPEVVSPNLAAIKIRHLLSMSCGHADEPWRESENWVETFLQHPVPFEPGTHFVYNSLSTYMCSAIVQKVTGQKIVDYLKPRLWEPLGIDDPSWETCPRGINTGGWGLKLSTESIAKFGQLFLQDGVWEGKRIVPEGWVAEATQKHVSNGDDPASDWAQGYGFQFWRCKHNAYRGDGAFGQYCVVMPDQDAVLAITSSMGDMQSPLNLVWDLLIPAMEGPSLSVPVPANSVVAPEGFAGTYEKIEGETASYRFSVTDRGVEVAWEHYLVEAGYDQWVEGAYQDSKFVAKAAWTSADSLVVRVFDLGGPLQYTLSAAFAGDTVIVKVWRRGIFAPEELPVFVGRK